jgi:uncharacterized membrane protein
MQKQKKSPLDLLIMLTLTVLALMVIFTPGLSNTFVGSIFVIPMILFIPGYVLMAALFPKKDDLEFIERIALSFGSSMAAALLIGLPLKFTLGTTSFPILYTFYLYILCTFTLAFIFIAAYRRKNLHDEERFSVPFPNMYEDVNHEISLHKNSMERISTGILIFLMFFAISTVYFVITAPKPGERFTEFYVLDPAGKADNYTTELKYNVPSEILVGVVNHEYSSVNYTVQVALGNEVLTDTWFSLNHNETWEKNVTFVPDKIGTDMRLEFWLFKEDNFTAPYRELYLLVSVKK